MLGAKPKAPTGIAALILSCLFFVSCLPLDMRRFGTKYSSFGKLV
jgi:hypothetical protein